MNSSESELESEDEAGEFPSCDDFLSNNFNSSINDTMQAAEDNVDTLAGTLNLVFEVVLTGVVVATGLVGNTLSIFALLSSTKQTRNTTPTILCVLAAIDILFLLSSLFFQMIGTLGVSVLKSAQVSMMKLFVPIFGIGNICRMSRNWLVVLVSLERYIAVKLPLKTSIICRKRNVRIGIIAILVVSTLLCLPRFFEVRIRHCVSADGTLLARAGPSSLRLNSVYRYAYTIGFYFLMVTAGPCLILLVLNTLLIVQVRRSNLTRSHLTQSTTDYKPVNVTTPGYLTMRHSYPIEANHRELQANGNGTGNGNGNSGSKQKKKRYSTEITRICIALVAVCLVCETPPLVYHIVLSIIGDETTSLFIDIMKPIANFFVSVNSGLNFYIYVFLGSRFRKHIVFCKNFRSHDLAPSSIRTTIPHSNSLINCTTAFTSPQNQTQKVLHKQPSAESPTLTSTSTTESKKTVYADSVLRKTCLCVSNKDIEIRQYSENRRSLRLHVNFRAPDK